MCMPNSNSQTNQIAQQQLQLANQQNNELTAQNNQTQANITAGNTSINNAFSQFDPNYYSKYQSDYTKNLTQPLANQYARAKDSETASLASRGLGQSTVGAQGQADIDQRNAQELGTISNQAAGATNTQKQTVANQENQLYSLNQAGNNPSGIATNAIGSASSLVNPQPQASLGNVFSDLLTPIGNFYKAGTGSTLGIGGTGQPASASPIVS
jgi:hypothetical protein